MNAIDKTKEQLRGLIVQCDGQISIFEKKVETYKSARQAYQHALTLLESNETEESRVKLEELIKE